MVSGAEPTRRQYHITSNDRGGLDAWDVAHLIALASDLPVSSIEIPEKEVDTVYWFDDDRNRPTVRKVIDHVRLIESADLRYPIILGADGRVMDGMHRIAKAILEGRSTIRAVRFAVDPEPDHPDCDPAELTDD